MLVYLCLIALIIAIPVIFFCKKIWKSKDREKTKKWELIIATLSIFVVFYIGIISGYIATQAKEISEDMLEVSQRMGEIEEERLRLLTFSVVKIHSKDFKIDEPNSSRKGERVIISNIGQYNAKEFCIYVFYIYDDPNEMFNVTFNKEKWKVPIQYEFKDLENLNKDYFKRKFLEEIETEQKYEAELENFISEANTKVSGGPCACGGELPVGDRIVMTIRDSVTGSEFFLCVKVEWDEGEDYAIYYFEK